MIELTGVQLELESMAGKVNILKGISFSIERGQTVSITGESGSGKSSLLAVMTGIEIASGGTITIAGVKVSDLDEDGLARFRQEHIGIVFQSFHLIDTMTAIDNVSLPLELQGEYGGRAKAREMLEQVGLGDRMLHYPGQLSGGEQQRVAIARSLVNEPDILFADEPTGNLDSRNSKAIADLLFSLQETQKMTLCLVTHDPALAARCNRTIVINDGVIHEERDNLPA